MDVIKLLSKVSDFIGPVPFKGKAKMKLAILAFLYCGEFVKSPIESIALFSFEN